MDRELKNIAAALGEERASRSKDVADLQRRLELAETGGLHITFVGAIWLFVGVLLATLAPEILCMQVVTPNKRLKLAGGDRSKGIEVLCP